MIKVLKPSRNKITQGYSSGHKAYDHSGRGDLNYYSSIYGKVTLSKNSETKNWINKGTLTTNDYGNYLKIKGQTDGKVVTQLGAHLEKGSVLPRGAEVKAGQVVARIGNTGNSTARHCHTEYRDSGNRNFAVTFVDTIEDKEETVMDNAQPKTQVIIDAYKALTGEYPTEDEKASRLQKNENTVDLIEDLLKGDGRSKPRWLDIWEVEDTKDQTSANYEATLDQFRETLRPLGVNMGDGSEKMLGLLSDAVVELVELRKKQTPPTKIVIAEKELSYIEIWGIIIGFYKK